MKVEGEGLSGTGAPLLRSAIADAQYILIGKDHLTFEIPQFTEAICNFIATQRFSGMERFMEGYDLLIIIPELTPAELAN